MERGKLIGIIGPVGSGKSSLLYAIMGEMTGTSGKITISNSIGVV